MDWRRGIRIMGIILIILIFSSLVIHFEFPAFDYANQSSELVEVIPTAIGPEVSRFLWTYRSIDLIAQAFVLFSTAVCCVALLRVEVEKE